MNIRANFGNALEALILLLKEVEEHQWITALETHFETWQQTGDASSHRSIYGGMGSFNDLLLFSTSHKLSEEEEPFASQLFQDLKSLCFILSTGQCFEQGELEQHLGVVHKNLQGWRCRRCGHAEVTPGERDIFLAFRLVRYEVLNAAGEGTLPQSVQRVLKLQFTDLELIKRSFFELAHQSKISIVRRTGWMQPCPRCKSQETCVYRWIQSADGVFLPAGDNLPMLS